MKKIGDNLRLSRKSKAMENCRNVEAQVLPWQTKAVSSQLNATATQSTTINSSEIDQNNIVMVMTPYKVR